MILTFYSFKGGVGRSMALANVARWLSLNGVRVAMIDWDLEAPGLERFFFTGPEPIEAVRNQIGLIDLLDSYCRGHSRLRDTLAGAKTLAEKLEILDDLLPPVRSALQAIPGMGGENEGALYLLASGWRAGDRFGSYAHAVQEFDWDDFYHSFDGQTYFEWLRMQVLSMVDVVLVDSRTGVTEMGGVCTRQLADVVVTFVAPNEQNLEGAVSMVPSFLRKDIEERRGRPAQAVLVPCRVDNFNETRINRFRKAFEEQTRVFCPEAFHTIRAGFWDLRIPYAPGYAYDERLAIGDPDGDKDLEESFKRLTAHLAMLAAPQTSFRRRMAGEIQRFFGRLLPIVSIAAAPADQVMVGEVARRLAEAEIPVWPSSSSGLRIQLEQSRFLVLVVGPQSLDSPEWNSAWRLARQLGVLVVPLAIDSSVKLEDKGVPSWMREATLRFIDSDWQAVLSTLAQPVALQRVPQMAYDLETTLLPRPGLQRRVIDALLQRPNPPRVVLQGLPGSGKSTLAVSVCRSSEIEDAFPDGVLWINFGHGANLSNELAAVHAALTGERSTFAGLSEAVHAVQGRLSGKRCLLVLDDVEEAQAARMLPLDLPGSTYLITTRTKTAAAELGGTLIEVGGIERDEAEALLQPLGAEWARQHAGRLHEMLGGNLSALRLIAGLLAGREGLDLEAVVSGFDRLLASGQGSSLAEGLAHVVDDLSEEDRTRLVDLAFREPDRPSPGQGEGGRASAQERPSYANLLARGLMAIGPEGQAYVQPLVRRYLVARYADQRPERRYDAVLAALSDEDRQVARRWLCRLVRVTKLEDDVLLEPASIRSQPTSASKASRDEEVLSLLVKGGVVTLGEYSSARPRANPWRHIMASNPTALVRWPLLRDWVREDVDFLGWRQRLDTYANDWRQKNDDAALLSGSVLTEAMTWAGKRPADLTEEETAFIEASSARMGSAPVPLSSGWMIWRWVGAGAVVLALVLGGKIWSDHRESRRRSEIETLVSQADAAVDGGDLDGALQRYTQALALQPDAFLLYKRGLARARRPSDLEQAIKDFDRSLELNPNQPSALAARAAAWLQLGNAERAVTDFTGALAQQPEDAELFYGRGVAQQAAQHPEAAREDFGKAILAKPDYIEARLARARLLITTGDSKGAEVDLRAVLETSTDPTTLEAARVQLRGITGAAAHPVPVAPSLPTVYLHYVDRIDSELTQDLARALRAQGFQVAGVQLVRGARTYGDVRFSSDSDAEGASRLASLVQKQLASQGYRIGLEVVRLDRKRFPDAKLGSLEVWLPPLSHPSLRLQTEKFLK